MFYIKYILNIYINLLFIIILVIKNNNGTRVPTGRGGGGIRPGPRGPPEKLARKPGK